MTASQGGNASRNHFARLSMVDDLSDDDTAKMIAGRLTLHNLNVKVNAYDKPFNYLLASLFWSPETMWMEVPVKVQKMELSYVQILIKLCSLTEVPTTSRQVNE
jgi:hypothetical protein